MRISIMAPWLQHSDSWRLKIKCSNRNAILLQKPGLRCWQENKTKSILKRQNNEEMENCQTAVRLGRRKTISNGMQNNVSDGPVVLVVSESASVCLWLCVCVCWESKRKTLKGRACFLLQPFVKGSVEKGGMCYLKSSTRGPSLPTCSAPALISAWEGRGEAFTEQALASRGLVVRFTETK